MIVTKSNIDMESWMHAIKKRDKKQQLDQGLWEANSLWLFSEYRTYNLTVVETAFSPHQTLPS